jgi:predicted RecB family endonuclease
MKGVRVGNRIIDGQAENDNEKIALEIKSGHDDIIRGIGQLLEALASGYKTALVVSFLSVGE